MKLELLKKHLEDATQIVSRVSNKNLSLPVLGCVVISATQNKTTLRATNLDVSVEIALKSKVVKEGDVAVPAHVFSQAVNAISDEKITLESDEGILKIITGHGEVKLNTIDVSDFPTLPCVKEGEGVSLTLPVKEFSRSLKGVVFAAATSGMRPELASVFLTVQDGMLITAATDSFRLSEIKADIKVKNNIDSILLPARNIPDILRVIERTDTVEVRVGENQVTYMSDGNFITSRVIDGAFPEYTAIIPKDFTTTATLLTEDLQRALKKVAVVTDQAGQVAFNLDPSSKLLSVNGVNTQVGESRESVDAALEGEPIQVNFNIRYILDALSTVVTDSLVFKFSGVGKPLIISEVPDKGFTYLVMPMNK
ncbi:MAG: DNA polymerase III subunit beta [Patescibacteria group bacterium UBA2163]